MYKTQRHIYWKLSERCFMEKRCTIFKSFGNPWSEAHPSASFVLPKLRSCGFWCTSGSMSCPTSGMSSSRLLSNPEDAKKKKKKLSTYTKMVSLQKTQQANRYSFYSPTQVPLHVTYLHSTLPPLPFTRPG